MIARRNVVGALIVIMLLAGAYGGGWLMGAGVSAGSAPRHEALPEQLFVGSKREGAVADGLAHESAFVSPQAALAVLPGVIDRSVRIRVDPGTYEGTLYLERFIMPAHTSPERLLTFREGSEGTSIRIEGTGHGGVILVAPRGKPCITATSVTLFVANLTCSSSSYNGIMIVDSTLVLDNVTVRTEEKARSGVHADRSTVLLGGDIDIVGPFTDAISIRTSALVRTQTPANPDGAHVSIALAERAIFLRDSGSFTTTFGRDRFEFRDLGMVVYAIFKSNVFLTSTSDVTIANVREGFLATHFSEVNIHHAKIHGMAGTLARCQRMSSITIESWEKSASSNYTVSDPNCEISLPLTEE